MNEGEKKSGVPLLKAFVNNNKKAFLIALFMFAQGLNIPRALRANAREKKVWLERSPWLVVECFHSITMLVYKTIAKYRTSFENNRVKFPTDLFAFVLYPNMAAVMSCENTPFSINDLLGSCLNLSL